MKPFIKNIQNNLINLSLEEIKELLQKAGINYLTDEEIIWIWNHPHDVATTIRKAIAEYRSGNMRQL
ncbi:hypothetical protein [Candidatus Methylacidiphilum infernorum]|uniref:Uncharacterized protein n=1 Tax=Methylacidiphilum infernorum (isolate V4) TaxID=481448 RepID=B3E0B4_METI4|nr:hypothetical protein [Candidatus Methylacidiphilum infernorum]ACD84343.1 Hypothetical protein Minf_2289 [Methylacidiphilum infernorum V4]